MSTQPAAGKSGTLYNSGVRIQRQNFSQNFPKNRSFPFIKTCVFRWLSSKRDLRFQLRVVLSKNPLSKTRDEVLKELFSLGVEGFGFKVFRLYIPEILPGLKLGGCPVYLIHITVCKAPRRIRPSGAWIFNGSKRRHYHVWSVLSVASQGTV